MHRFLLLLSTALLIGPSQHGQGAQARPNVLLICIDDLRPELGCYGVDYIHSPNIDRLASQGRLFRRHYVQAPTCGASRFTLLTGRYGGAGNQALFQRATELKNNPQTVSPSMPAWFRNQGYTTVSVGKVSHHPGGLGGPDWNDPTKIEMPHSWDRSLLPFGPWQHPRGWMHGLANGEIRVRAEEMDLFQSIEGPDTIYPDGDATNEALRQIDQLSDDPEHPFFLAVGILRPHLPFGAPAQYLQTYKETRLPPISHPGKPTFRTTWHRSGEFMKYNRWDRDPNNDEAFALLVRQHYAACVSYADAQVGRLLKRLNDRDQRKKTIIVLWGDHGWHLGEHAVWGKHTLFEESLHSPLIISHPGIKQPGASTEAMVETLDIFPTLCDLAGLPMPGFVDGVSLRSQLDHTDAPGHPAVAYQRNARTLRTTTHRLIDHNDGYVELYDHRSEAKETQNTADDAPDLVSQLRQQLNARLNR